MQPVPGKNFAVAAFALCNLILMMREYQILSACMDINLFSQIFFRHNRTLNMPSRTAITPRRRPGRFAFFFRFPQYKIKRIFFLVFTGHQKRTVSRAQIIQIFMRKFAIFFKTACTEIYRTVYIVSISFFNKCGDHIDHAVNFLCCQRMCGGRFNIHACHILFALCNVTLGNFFCCHALFVCFCNDLVIDICEV